MTYFPFKVCKTHSKLSEISPESAFSILFPILLEQEKAVHLYSDIFHKRSPQLELQCFILMPPFPIFKVVQKSSLSPPFQLIMSATSCSIILNTSQYSRYLKDFDISICAIPCLLTYVFYQKAEHSRRISNLFSNWYSCLLVQLDYCECDRQLT